MTTISDYAGVECNCLGENNKQNLTQVYPSLEFNMHL